MADATDWLRSNRLTSPLGNWRALPMCIDLVKLPSEAVGSEREDSRAAATLVFFGHPLELRPRCNDAPPQAQVQLLCPSNNQFPS
jgi:hypothetical protein